MTASHPQLKPESPPKAADQEEVDNLEILWRWLSVPLFLYCLGLWIRSQSDNYELLSFIAKDHKVAVVTGLFATPVAFVSLWLAMRYGRLRRVSERSDRVPRIIEKGLDGNTGRGFRLVLFLGAWFVIVGSQIHFVDAMLAGSAVDTTPKLVVTVQKGAIEMLTKWPAAASSHDFRFGDEHGPTFFPVIEPWFWLISVSVLASSFIGYLFRTLKLHRR